MKDIKPVVGWTSAWLSGCATIEYTKERKQALVDRIRKRKYNFNWQDHNTLFYTAPYYEDGVICILNKQQWDETIKEAYKDEPFGPRLMPEDVIERSPINGVIYEKEKWELKQ